MIIRVWGIVNNVKVDFSPIKERPNYWEGYAPRIRGLQDIEIWAENDKGARGHLQCSVLIQWHTHTEVKMILSPYIVQLYSIRHVSVLKSPYHVMTMPISK